MENASKALIMAGGVLISLMVIGLLVLFYNNLSGMQKIKTDSETEQQAAEFNKQYDVYARDIYGSEILSIANKIADYNLRESDNKGYTKIELKVKLNKDIDDTYFKKGEYSSEQLKDKVKTIEKDLKEYSQRDKSKGHFFESTKMQGYSRTTAQLATMRTNDIEELYDEQTILQIKNDVQKYNNLKNLVTTFKEKTFKYKKFEYDNNNGRITLMNYELN